MSEALESGAHVFDCGGCGARLTFKPGSGNTLNCEYCGHEQKIPKPAAAETGPPPQVKEYDFHQALTQARRKPAAELVQGGHEVSCKSCGATTVLAGQAGNCPYCDSPVVAVTPNATADEGVIVPESVLPFRLDERKARDAFSKWVGSLWFAPNDLSARCAAEGMDGVYLPYWTYDSHTTTSYRGERGVYYYETVSYTDSDGKRQTRRERRTRWYPASGVVRVPFDDVLVCASKGLPSAMIDSLEPWDLHDLKPYDPAYLSGFIAERYAVDLQSGFKIAEEKMKPTIRQTCCSDIGGDTQRVSSMAIRHADVTFKHCLLPLWISSFRYAEKVYRFVVNARTGEVAGERPWSWIKIALAVLAGLFALGLIVAIVAAMDGG